MPSSPEADALLRVLPAEAAGCEAGASAGACRTETALRQAQARLQAIFEGVETGILLIDPEEHRIVDANPVALGLVGARREQVVGAVCHRFVCPAETGKCPVTDLGQTVDNSERVLLTATGDRRAIIKTVRPVNVDGRPLLLESFLDITARQQDEQDLVERTAYLDTLIDVSPLGIAVLDQECRIQLSNTALERLFLYSREEMKQLRLDEVLVPEDLGAEAAHFTEQCLKGRSVHFISQRRRRDGSLVHVEVYGVPVSIPGKPTCILALYSDISERKLAEERLRSSEERYRDLFENASDLVYTFDIDLNITSLNRLAEKATGYSREQAVGMSLKQMVSGEDWDRVVTLVAGLAAGEPPEKFEVDLQSQEGRRITLEVNPRLILREGEAVGIQAIARDITGRDVAEIELRQAQKLESVGRLASGIAHEMNTPMQFVGDNVRFLQDSFGTVQELLNRLRAFCRNFSSTLAVEFERLEKELDTVYLLEEIPGALTQTREGVERVITIVRAMKEFAHPESRNRTLADLNKALVDTLTVARNEVKYVADVETDLGELPMVLCSLSDLNQVFLNLLVNAAHAIGDRVQQTGQRGKIRIHSESDGQQVLITIADDGAGIPAGIRERIFDPFFTTKEVGRGTGQGLAIARSVIDRHKGSLTFESEVGRGTTFFVRLPIEHAQP